MKRGQVSSLPNITVIVASFNSLSRSFLNLCLSSIKDQSYNGKVQLIVVDGGSTDGSIELASSMGAEIVHNPQVTELGFSGGKNLGFHRSTGEYIAIIDADNVLVERDYLAKMISPFLEDNDITMTMPMPYDPIKSKFGSLCNPICRYFCLNDLRGTIYISEHYQVDKKASGKWIKLEPMGIAVPNGAIIKRSALEKIGGFDYDTEVVARLFANGLGHFALVTTAHRLHLEMLTYRQVYKKFKRRVLHQIQHRNDKPEVQRQIKGIIKNPRYYFKTNLFAPLLLLFRERDITYFQALPVFIIQTFLFIRYFKALTEDLYT